MPSISLSVLRICKSLRHWSSVGSLLRALACFIAISIPTYGNAGPETECYRAIQHASQATGVSEKLLLAIAKTETGRTIDGAVRPWPWAINIRGTGQWFENEFQLLERALEQIAKGETSFDLGCFQLNYRWHGQAFDSIDEMISPKENAMYAAQFLKKLYAEFNDWGEAVGAYHSRHEARANAYKTKFEKHFETDQSDKITVASNEVSASKTRRNSFPLLQSTTAKPRLGSLVPNSTN